MRKGIGPQGLGASKSPAKMYGTKSPAKQTKEYSDKGTKLRAKAEKANEKERDKKALKLNAKADKYDKKQVSGLMGSLEKSGAFNTKSPAKKYKK